MAGLDSRLELAWDYKVTAVAEDAGIVGGAPLDDAPFDAESAVPIFWSWMMYQVQHLPSNMSEQRTLFAGVLLVADRLRCATPRSTLTHDNAPCHAHRIQSAQ